jgi:hypothetical protein
MTKNFARAARASALTLIVAAAGTVASGAARADDSSLCVANACLGMTAAQVAQLPLTPDNSMIKFALKSSVTGGASNYGLDADGKRIFFIGAGADKTSLSEFNRKVKTICNFDGTWVNMKASDGQRIQLTLRPFIRDGKAELVLAEINRTVPPTMSQAQMKAFIEQAKARYGDAWVSNPYASSAYKAKPHALVQIDISQGQVLKLEMPWDVIGARREMMAQPGCSSKASLD